MFNCNDLPCSPVNSLVHGTKATTWRLKETNPLAMHASLTWVPSTAFPCQLTSQLLHHLILTRHICRHCAIGTWRTAESKREKKKKKRKGARQNGPWPGMKMNVNPSRVHPETPTSIYVQAQPNSKQIARGGMSQAQSQVKGTGQGSPGKASRAVIYLLAAVLLGSGWTMGNPWFSSPGSTLRGNAAQPRLGETVAHGNQRL